MSYLRGRGGVNELRLGWQLAVQGPPGVLPAVLLVHSGQVPRTREEVVGGAPRAVVGCAHTGSITLPGQLPSYVTRLLHLNSGSFSPGSDSQLTQVVRFLSQLHVLGEDGRRHLPPGVQPLSHVTEAAHELVESRTWRRQRTVENNTRRRRESSQKAVLINPTR